MRFDATMSRRTLLRGIAGGALATSALGLVAACGGDDDDDDGSDASSDSPTSTSASEDGPTATSDAGDSARAEGMPEATKSESGADGSGEWSFTDDRGVTITLPSRPERVVAYVPLAASLWDFGIEVAGIFGTSRGADGTPEIYAGSLDLDSIESLGETYGEIDLEALLALGADLIVTDMWPTLDLYGLPAEDAARVEEEIAPVAGIKFVDQPVTDTLASLEALAEALGADLSAPKVAEAHERFDQAAADVEAAAAEKPELITLVASGGTDNFYVANPSYWADLTYFQQLGLNFVSPEIEPDALWETLSWEQAGKYPSDLVLVDLRSGTGSLTVDDMAEIPTWKEHPAVKAGQIGGWYTEFVPSYAGYAAILEDLAETIRNSRGDVV